MHFCTVFSCKQPPTTSQIKVNKVDLEEDEKYDCGPFAQGYGEDGANDVSVDEHLSPVQLMRKKWRMINRCGNNEATSPPPTTSKLISK
jgi:hypothetical protein